jgi:isopentenyl diphosphate isomerase/L-lactate dehydrogenase-like FMN-dependent dehydrogenase
MTTSKPSHAAVDMFRLLRAGGLEVDRLAGLPTVADFRARARRRLPRMAFDFIDGGAGAELTRRANLRDLAEVSLVPRTMVDVSTVDLTSTLNGQPLPMPVVLAPCGLVRIAGGEGELAAVRAAGKVGTPYTISTASSWSIEEIAEQATGPLWFQLYLWRSRDVVRTLVERARAAGCSALVVTTDVVVNGKRPRDHRNGMSIPPRITARNALATALHPGWFLGLLRGPAIGFRNLQGIAEGSSAMSHQEYVNTELANLSPSWEDLVWLRRQWSGPLYVKGVMGTEDADAALAAGADGLWVSNHGGRQLDSAPSSVSVLPRILDAVGGRVPVLLDGGIRSGTDVVKVLAMGASAVAIGRSWVWGVAAAGERGVDRVLDIYRQEIVETLQLLGRPTLDELTSQLARYPTAWAS